MAARLLEDRGTTFREAESLLEATTLIEGAVRHVRTDADVVGASASVMQAAGFRDSEYVGGMLTQFAIELARIGDDRFYGGGDSDEALDCYQLAAGLDPSSVDAHWETLSVCLQGQPMRPCVAIPYAVVVAHLDPRKDEVDEILAMCAARG